MKYLLNIVLAASLLMGCAQSEKDTNEQENSQSTPNVVGEEVSYSTDDLMMSGYIAYDENMTDKRPGILVVHEWWGHNEYARSRAEDLAELGYVALAVDMYGEGKQAEHPEDAQKFSGQVMSNFDAAQNRFIAAMQTLKDNSNVDDSKIGAIGYCFGGSVVIAMANAGVDLDGVVGFHAGLQLPVMPKEGQTTARVLVLNGAEDPFVTDEQAKNLDAAMETANVDYTYVEYDSVKHSYTNPDADTYAKEFDLPLAYNKQADQKSWARMKQFFETTFEDSNAPAGSASEEG